MRHGIWLLSTLLVGLTACREQPAGVTTYVDSAGVRHTTTADASRVFAVVDGHPTLSLGGPEATEPTQFFRIRGIHVDSQGNLWIADGGSSELRIFRPDGSLWKIRGGGGQGPGEFERIRLLGSFRGDTVAVWDDGNPRLTVFDPQGEMVRTVRAQQGDDPAPNAMGVFSDGSLLAKKPILLWAGDLRPGEMFGDTVSLVRVDLERRTEEAIGLAYGPLWVFTGSNQVPIPFTINAPLAVQEEDVHLAVGADFQIQVFQDGQLTEEYGVDRSPRAVTGDDLEAYVGLYAEVADPAQRNEILSTLDHSARPGHLPSYDRLVVAENGNVWAGIYTPDRSGLMWDVYAPTREWLGQVELPPGFYLSAVSAHRIVGVWRDELGVEYVRVYGFRLTP